MLYNSEIRQWLWIGLKSGIIHQQNKGVSTPNERQKMRYILLQYRACVIPIYFSIRRKHLAPLQNQECFRLFPNYLLGLIIPNFVIRFMHLLYRVSFHLHGRRKQFVFNRPLTLQHHQSLYFFMMI